MDRTCVPDVHLLAVVASVWTNPAGQVADTVGGHSATASRVWTLEPYQRVGRHRSGLGQVEITLVMAVHGEASTSPIADAPFGMMAGWRLSSGPRCSCSTFRSTS